MHNRLSLISLIWGLPVRAVTWLNHTSILMLAPNSGRKMLDQKETQCIFSPYLR